MNSVDRNNHSSYKNFDEISQKGPGWKEFVAGLGAVAVLGSSIFFYKRYHVSTPSQYIVRTGLGIKDVKISKKALQLPFQTAQTFSIEPKTYHVTVNSMSSQRIPFKLPSVWTIGPDADDVQSLDKYARLVMDKPSNEMTNLVHGIIQGEQRVLTANLDLDQLFSGRKEFKVNVSTEIEKLLKPFGLIVYNANIEELADLDKDNSFFEEQKKRALQQVNQEARVNVAHSIREGEIGEKAQQGETRKNIATIEAAVTLTENERKKEIAESKKNLQVAEAAYTKEVKIAEAEAKAAAENRSLELQLDVEISRKKQEIERRRALDLSAADVEAEIVIRRADGEAQAMKLHADAVLYSKQKEADANLAIAQAQAEGLRQLIESAGGTDGLIQYLLIEKNVLPQLAAEQAEAVRGMKPNISIWNTGNSDSAVSGALTDLFKTGMPLFDGIKQQTGYDFLKFVDNKKKSNIE